MSVTFWKEQNGLNHITPGGKWIPEGYWLPEYLDGLKSGSVLEFGCGPGRLAGQFEPSGYVGVDISANAITHARERNPAHDFRVTDETERLGPVDTILCHTVLLHVPDEALDGVLSRFDAKRVLVNEMLGREWRRAGTPPVFNRRLDEYVAAFAKAGFRLGSHTERLYEHYRKPMALLEFIRNS